MRTPPIPIIYRDEDLLIVSKPSGLVVHRGWANPQHTLVDLLREQLALDHVHVLHRLDRGTSGVMAFALNPDAAKQISAAFKARQVLNYLARSRQFSFSGILDHPIPKAPGEPQVDARRHSNTWQVHPHYRVKLASCWLSLKPVGLTRSEDISNTSTTLLSVTSTTVKASSTEQLERTTNSIVSVYTPGDSS